MSEFIYNPTNNSDSDGMEFSSGVRGVNVDDTTIEISSDNLQVKALGVDTAQLAANAVSLAKVEAEKCLGIIAEDAKTTSVEENVAGLSSAITLANALKATYNLHLNDQGGTGEEHKAQDTAMVVVDATDLDSCIALLTEIQDSYVAHDDDAILGSDWVYHQAQGTEKALASASNPTTLATCISIANDIKAKLNDHMDDATAHTAGDSAQEAESDSANGAAILVTVANAASGDLVFWSILNDGSGSVTGVSAVAGTGTITFTFSADPQHDSIISYGVIRAAS